MDDVDGSGDGQCVNENTAVLVLRRFRVVGLPMHERTILCVCMRRWRVTCGLRRSLRDNGFWTFLANVLAGARKRHDDDFENLTV
eukprot:6213574-Pleurochrysis_carterae.AAC.1